MQLEGNPVEQDRRGLPLKFKLPLLISVLLLALLAACVIVAYHEVRDSAYRAANERLQRISSDLAQLTQAFTNSRQTLSSRIAGDPAVVAALLNRRIDDSAAVRVLRRLTTAQDSSLPIELWTINGERIVRYGRDQVWGTAEAPAIQSPAVSDNLHFHPFIVREDRAYFWVTIPVRSGGEQIGTIAQLRQVGSPQAEKNLARIFGTDLKVAFVDSTLDQWVSIGGAVTPETKPRLGDGPQVDYKGTGNAHIGYFAKIPNTPWAVVVETPIETVLARPHNFLRSILILSMLLLAIGFTAAWLLARYVTAPLAELTRAAANIARGDYTQHVPSDRSDELGELGHAFNVMARKVNHAFDAAEKSRTEALAASSAKSEFLATMSHEIRTPINAMLGYADLLEYGIAGPVTQGQQEQIARIKRSGRHLVGLVDDVLDFAKLESGQLRVHPRTASAHAAVETAASLLFPLAEEKGLKLELQTISPDLEYFGDPQRVEQILVNLISNAVKFTEAGGSIRVGAKVERNNGSSNTVFTIEDTGVGIPPEQLGRIFEPFVQAEQGYTRTKGGSGLGLTISRRLARLMRGDVIASAGAKQGAAFNLVLPTRN